MSDLPIPTGHLGLNVTDLDRSIRFYRDVFNLTLVGESGDPDRRFAFLGDGRQIVLTLWQQSRGDFAADRAGLHHLAFEVPTVEDVRAVERKLRALDVRFVYDGVVAQGEGAQAGGIYFEDPDGIRLEIYAPTGAEGLAAPVSGAPTCGFFS
jgi:catechol 2,3-dioxygenase-like lactoylglutathione lyase family enzyme